MSLCVPKTLLLSLALCGFVVPVAHAQDAAFGVGGRMSMIRADDDADVDSDRVRFLGGHIRLRMSPRTGVEVSLERRTETNDAETQRVRTSPLQASLLLFPVRGGFAPYLLGGGGWYTSRLETLDPEGDVLESDSVRDFGWHAGLGAEIRLGRHAAVHADYRYTFLDFKDDEDDDDDDGLISGLLPSHRGSMWTVGLTVYF